MSRHKANTVDSGEALELYDKGGADGPLGDLTQAGVSALRNDLPFGESFNTEDDQLTALFSQVTGTENAEGFVSIWKTDEKSRRLEYVGKAGISDFTAEGPHDFLARNFGAGEYELKIYDSNKKLFRRPRTTVSKLAEDFIRRQTAVKPAGNGASDMAGLVAVMAAGFDKLGQLIVQNHAPAPAAVSRREILDEMMLMKQVLGGDNKTDPVAMFTQMAGVLKQIMPREPGEENVFMGLLDRFGPMITEAIKNQPPASALPNPAAVAAQPGATPAASVQPSQPALTPEQQGARQMSLQLKMQLLYLCTQAARDADPGPYAAIIVDQVPEDVLQPLINDPNWLDQLAKFHSNVRQFPEWFNELREAVIEEMQETPPDKNLQTQNSGDINPGNNGDSEDVLE